MDLGGGGVIRRYIFGLVIVLLWVENGVKCSEKAALEGLHPHYEIYLGKAIAHARCREKEIMPTMDTKKMLMKPSGCDSAACQDCIKKADRLETTKETLSNFKSKGYTRTTISPRPVFHCTAYKSSDECLGQSYFRMEYESNPPNASEYVPRMFLVEKQVGDEWKYLILQFHWLFGICIQDSRPHRIRVTAVSPKHVFFPQVSDVIQLPPRGEQSPRVIPSPKNIRVHNMTLDPLSAIRNPFVTLRWESNSGLSASCHYFIHYMDDHEHMTLDRNGADNAFWADIRNLRFGKNYTVHVVEQSRYFIDSPSAILEFTVQSCLDFRHFNYSFCAPPRPESLRVENETDDSFWVVWDPPKNYSRSSVDKYELMIERYSISTLDLHRSHRPIFRGTIEGTKTWKKISNVTAKGTIRIGITAFAHGQTSPEAMTIHHLTGAESSGWGMLYWIGGFFLLVAAVGGGCYFGKRYQEKQLRIREQKELFEVSSVSCRVPQSDVIMMGKTDLQKGEAQPVPQVNRYSKKWEIEYESLIIGDVIGQGQFGQVRKAELYRNRTRTTVAVKTLRDGSDSAASEKFWEEFDILEKLGPNANMNLVGLVGIVVEPIRALVVEYCDAGDLRTHLKKALKAQTERQRGAPMMNSFVHLSSADAVQVQLDMVTNESYFLNEPEPEITVLPQDLMSYSWQIACGMEFLSGYKIVHRDLAARNILICGGTRTLKIADFGLSRDIYEENCYTNKTNVVMPIKWLAVECLLQDVYTTKSDVWAYGVVLYEIFTFGGNPYPGIPNSEIFNYIKSGCRMKKPELCSDEVYDLMKKCWNADPLYRPDFVTLRRKLEELIETSSYVPYLNCSLDTSGSAGGYHSFSP